MSMKNHDTEGYGTYLFFFSFFVFILWIMYTSLIQYKADRRIFMSQQMLERNLIQCYQNGTVYVTYTAGHIYVPTDNTINFTTIDTSTDMTINTTNCTITKLEPAK